MVSAEDEDLHNRYLDVCSKLALQNTLIEEAWCSFEAINGNFTLEVRFFYFVKGVITCLEGGPFILACLCNLRDLLEICDPPNRSGYSPWQFYQLHEPFETLQSKSGSIFFQYP